jgi:hypothetical protein
LCLLLAVSLQRFHHQHHHLHHCRSCRHFHNWEERQRQRDREELGGGERRILF